MPEKHLSPANCFRFRCLDDTQTAITTVILRPEILTHLGDVGDLTLDNEALVLLSLGHLFSWAIFRGLALFASRYYA